jgi:hypothetical protein
MAAGGARASVMPVIGVERNPRGQRALIVGPGVYLEGIMEETDSAREARLRELASRLLFTLSKEDSRFSLYRETDVPHPVRHDGLTLDGVEETLTTWKLRGPHGG